MRGIQSGLLKTEPVPDRKGELPPNRMTTTLKKTCYTPEEATERSFAKLKTQPGMNDPKEFVSLTLMVMKTEGHVAAAKLLAGRHPPNKGSQGCVEKAKQREAKKAMALRLKAKVLAK